MFKINTTKLRRWNLITHRDFGYFFTALILIYSISGIALNHVNDWDSNFLLTKQTLHLDKVYEVDDIDDQLVMKWSKEMGEEKFKLYDSPTPDQVKIYYQDATLHVYLTEKEGVFEQVSRRPFFYQTNAIHLNSVKGWKWFADIFAFFLILITITGLFIRKGKKGFRGRGKWFFFAGFIPPIIAVLIMMFG